MRFIVGFSLFSLFSLVSFAEVPVVDVGYSEQVYVPNDRVVSGSRFSKQQQTAEPFGVSARLERLERQMTYLEKIKVVSNQLQQEMRDLRGLIEMQGHQIQELQKQQRNLYTDLDKRVSGISSTKDGDKRSVVPLSSGNVSEKVLSSKKEEVRIYETAFGAIKDKRYSVAISEMHDYLKAYPSGRYVANAHYWLGELFILSGKTDLAVKEFSTVIDQYTNADKVSDSLLKLGVIAYDRSDFVTAKKKWQLLVKKYPNSSAARIASSRLNQLDKEGV